MTTKPLILDHIQDYLDYIELTKSNKIVARLHELSKTWRHRNIQYKLDPSSLERAKELFRRADGNLICSICGERYGDHPTLVDCDFIHRVCSVGYVKT